MGCPACYYTGYKGRKAVFELLPVTRSLAEMIKVGRGDIEAYQMELGLPTLKHNLTTFVGNGVTTLEEVVAHLEG